MVNLLAFGLLFSMREFDVCFSVDFCFWAPPEPGRAVGEIEGEMVAWCTQPGHGTRVIPDGTITGVQFTKAPNYVQVVGFMDQTKVDMVAGDSGGEMDPHGADLVRVPEEHIYSFR
jgi:hypothetical protein